MSIRFLLLNSFLYPQFYLVTDNFESYKSAVAVSMLVEGLNEGSLWKRSNGYKPDRINCPSLKGYEDEEMVLDPARG